LDGYARRRMLGRCRSRLSHFPKTYAQGAGSSESNPAPPRPDPLRECGQGSLRPSGIMATTNICLRYSLSRKGSPFSRKEPSAFSQYNRLSILHISTSGTILFENCSRGVSAIPHIYPSVLQALAGRGYAGRLEGGIAGVSRRGYAGSWICTSENSYSTHSGE